MGFRCPICKRDFGNNKDELEKHLKDEGHSYEDKDIIVYNLSDLIKNSDILNIKAKLED